MGLKTLVPLVLLSGCVLATLVDDQVLETDKQLCNEFDEVHVQTSNLVRELWGATCQNKTATIGKLDFLNRMLEFDRLLREYDLDAQRNGCQQVLPDLSTLHDTVVSFHKRDC